MRSSKNKEMVNKSSGGCGVTKWDTFSDKIDKALAYDPRNQTNDPINNKNQRNRQKR